MERLIAELLKAQDNLSEIKFKINKEQFTFYFRYLTLLEKVRIEQMSVKTTSIIKTDGTREVTHEKQDHLIPIYTILEKALNEDGKRLFSHTDQKHFKLVSDLPATVSAYVAYEMSLDILGSMTQDEGENNE